MQNEITTSPLTRKKGCPPPVPLHANPILANSQCSETIERRFWAKVDKNGPIPPHCPSLGPCWIWTAVRDLDGYGHIGRGAKSAGKIKAPSLSWLIHNGEIPKGIYVCHFCDNSSCVNPKHLWLGTHEQNEADKVNKGRSLKGERSPRSKLSESQVLEIRAMYNRGGISSKQLGKLFGVGGAAVLLIVKRVNWAHI